MEKLELKHLSPYLPYGLRIDYGYTNPINNTRFNFKLNGTNISKILSFSEWKPILKPIDFKIEYELRRWDSFEKLFSEHYDVFGLIPKGLAIDINTLEQTN